MMLHYHPDLVRLDAIPKHGPAEFPPYDMYPTRTDWVPPSGVLSSARGATREKGVMITDEVIARVAAAVRAESTGVILSGPCRTDRVTGAHPIDYDRHFAMLAKAILGE